MNPTNGASKPPATALLIYEEAMNKDQIELLAARTLIANKKYWTRDVVARDKKGNSCDVTSPKAEQFCAVGALTFVHEGNDYPEKCWRYLHKAAQELGSTAGPATLNDEMSHAKVMQMYDRAIELAGK